MPDTITLDPSEVEIQQAPSSPKGLTLDPSEVEFAAPPKAAAPALPTPAKPDISGRIDMNKVAGAVPGMAAPTGARPQVAVRPQSFLETAVHPLDTDSSIAAQGKRLASSGLIEDTTAARLPGTLAAGPRQVVQGAKDYAASGALQGSLSLHPKDLTPQQKEQGLAGVGEMLGGTMQTGALMGAPEMVELGRLADSGSLAAKIGLLKLVGGLEAGNLSADAADAASKKLGLSPATSNLLQTAAFFLPGFLGFMGSRSGLVDGVQAQVGDAQAFGFSVPGVKFGTAQGPQGTLSKLKVGSREFTYQRDAASPAPPAAPSAPQLVGQQAVQGAIATMTRYQGQKAAAQQAVAGVPPPEPAPPPMPVGMEKGWLPQGVVQNVASMIQATPPEMQPQMMMQAHDKLAEWMTQQGRFIGPDGKLQVVEDPKQAAKLAQQIVNDAVDNHIARTKHAAAQQQSAATPPLTVADLLTKRPAVVGKRPAVVQVAADRAATLIDAHQDLAPAQKADLLTSRLGMDPVQAQQTVQAQQQANPPVVTPEARATVDAQLESLKSGGIPAVMIPESSTYNPVVPGGMKRITVSGDKPGAGTYIYNPAKVQARTIKEAAANGTHGDLLGHLQPKEEVIAAPQAVGLQARAADGTPIQDSVSTPERAAEQAQELQARHEAAHPGMTVEARDPREVVVEREQAVEQDRRQEQAALDGNGDGIDTSSERVENVGKNRQVAALDPSEVEIAPPSLTAQGLEAGKAASAKTIAGFADKPVEEQDRLEGDNMRRNSEQMDTAVRSLHELFGPEVGRELATSSPATLEAYERMFGPEIASEESSHGGSQSRADSEGARGLSAPDAGREGEVSYPAASDSGDRQGSGHEAALRPESAESAGEPRGNDRVAVDQLAKGDSIHFRDRAGVKRTGRVSFTDGRNLRAKDESGRNYDLNRDDVLGHIQSKREIEQAPSTVTVQASRPDGTPIQDSEMDAARPDTSLQPVEGADRSDLEGLKPITKTLDAKEQRTRETRAHLVDPNVLIFREHEQPLLDKARERFPDGEYWPITVMRERNGELHIIDGHHRTVVAMERGDQLPVLEIAKSRYEALKEQGFDDIEISAGMLANANEDSAWSSMLQSFSGSDLATKSIAVQDALDELPYDAESKSTSEIVAGDAEKAEAKLKQHKGEHEARGKRARDLSSLFQRPVLENRPLAITGLNSYRHMGVYGSHVMIGAKSHADALAEAARNISSKPEMSKLEIWNGSEYVSATETNDPATSSHPAKQSRKGRVNPSKPSPDEITYRNAGVSLSDVTKAIPEPVREFFSDIAEKTHEARDLQGGLYDLDSMAASDVIRAQRLMQETPGSAADQAAIYHHIEDPSLPLTAEQEKVLEQYVAPIQAAAKQIHQRLVDSGVNIPSAGDENYIRRIVKGKGSALDRAMAEREGKTPRVSSPGGRNNLSTKQPGAVKRRTMMALESDAGERRVISIKGGRVTAWENGKPTDMGAHKSGFTTRLEQIDPGLEKAADRILDAKKALADLPEQDKQRRIASIDEQIATRERDRKVLEKGATNSLDPAGAASYSKRQSLSKEIADLQRSRAALVSGREPMSVSGLKRKETLQKALDQATADRNELLDRVPTSKMQDVVWEDRDGNSWTIKQATTKEITANTDLEYHENALVSTVTSYLEMRKYERALDFLEAFKTKPTFSKIGMKPEGPGELAPDGWLPTTLPQFRGYYFEPRTAEVLDWYNERLQAGEPDVLQKANSFLTSSLFFNPFVHLPNLLFHWTTEKGVTGWANLALKRGQYRATIKAINAVLHRNDDFLAVLDAGGPMQSQREETKHYSDILLSKLTDEMAADKTTREKVASALGYANPLKMLDAMKEVSGKITWYANDIMFLQAAYEKTAKGMDLKAALNETAKHVPDYRLPTRVLDSKLLGDVMRNPLLTAFSSYHYGALKSYGKMAQSATGAGWEPQGENAKGEAVNEAGRTDQGEKFHALDVMAALGLMTVVILPLVDKLLKKATGDPDAEFRRAGATTIPYDVMLMAKGEKTPSEIAQSILTPGVGLKAAMELGFNRDIRTGRHIYNAGDSARDIAEEVGTRLLSSFGPGSEIQRAGRSGTKKELLGLVGVGFHKHGALKIASLIASEKAGADAMTPEDAKRYRAHMDAVDAVRGGNLQAAQQILAKAGTPPEERRKILRAALGDPLLAKVRSFSVPEMKRVMQAATPAERARLEPLLRGKERRAREAGKAGM